MLLKRLNKHQKNYDYLVKVLQESGIDSEEKIKQQIRRALIRACWFSVAILLILLVLWVVSPQYGSLSAFFALLGLASVWSSALGAIRIMRKFARDELKDPG